MTAPTHIAFAELLYLLILTTTGVALTVPNALLIAVSSVLPDIDTGASRIGRFLPFVSFTLERRFGHRTFTHSLACVFLFSLLLSPLCLIGRDIYTCLVMGYLSHPLLDTGTVNGTKLFYPFSGLRCVFPLEASRPQRYRIQTGSRNEKVLGVIFFVCCIPTFYVASQGYERFIRVTQRSIEAAVRDYEEFSRDHFVTATIESYDMLTKQAFMGSYEIVGAINPHTLVFKTPDGRLHTIGKSFEADYVAESIVCQKDRPAYASVRTVDMSNQLLAQLFALVDTSVENYFFGDVTTIDKVSLPENIHLFSSVTGSGGVIKLNFATPNDIREYNLELVYVTKGILTIKSIFPVPASGDPSSSGQNGHAFSGSGDSSCTRLSLPKFDTYSQLSYLVEPRDSVILIKQQGDTIRQGDILATKTTISFYEEELTVNEEKLAALTTQQSAALEDYDRRIAAAELDVAIDSADYLHARTLLKSGFLSSGQIFSYELKLHRERAALHKLHSSKRALARKIVLDIARFHLRDSQMREKARGARLQSEIRSPIGGILLEVRHLPQDGKTRLVFIVKRF